MQISHAGILQWKSQKDFLNEKLVRIGVKRLVLPVSSDVPP